MVLSKRFSITQHMLALLACSCLWALSGQITSAAEYFVRIDGSDSLDGLSQANAFRTIQKGVNCLQAGDTLTIGPGEYFESVQRHDLGNEKAPTTIRAAIPGSVLLRGDVPAPVFKPVPERRFTWVCEARADRGVQMVVEVDSLRILKPVATLSELEYSSGGYFYDSAASKLYLSTSDWRHPSEHYYTISVIPAHGLYLLNPRKVVIEGLAATGFNTAHELHWQQGTLMSTWGIFLAEATDCVVRDCKAFLNGGGGIGINSLVRRHQGYGGNVIERCEAWGNGSQFAQGDCGGLTLFEASRDVIRDSVAYLNQAHGINIYGGGAESNEPQNKSSLLRNVTWGNPRCDLKIKTGYENVHTAVRCVALDKWGLHGVEHCLLGSSSARDAGPGTIVLKGEASVDLDQEFADPINHDYRLQATSRFRAASADERDQGPYPYKANVFYVRPNGDDAADGLSMADAWKTLSHALERLRAGDTLYLAPGHYGEKTTLAIEGTEEAPIAILGRGRTPVVLGGSLQLDRASHVRFERLCFSNELRVRGGQELTFANCQFDGSGIGLDAENISNLVVRHCEFTRFDKAAVVLGAATGVQLAGNTFNNRRSPALVLEKPEAVRYSDYNSYANPAAAWTTGPAVHSLEHVQQRRERHSRAITPEHQMDQDRSVLQNRESFLGRGPFGRSIGNYRHDMPRAELRVVKQPSVHSVSATTANIEWMTSLPAVCELSWGRTPACENRDTFQVNCFGSYSLTGLRPGETYFLRLDKLNVPADLDQQEYVTISPTDGQVISFTTLAADSPPATYYVAPTGDDQHNGLSRHHAWKTLGHAAAQVKPGDTVMVARGTYSERVRLRATGEAGASITFRSVPGETVKMDGAAKTLSQGFVAAGKSHLRFDGFYFADFGREHEKGWPLRLSGEFNLHGGRDIQITRCFSDGRNGYTARSIIASHVQNLLIQNCVTTNKMGGSIYIWRCPGVRIEHCVFARPLIQSFIIRNAADQQVTMSRNIFTDMLAKKADLNIAPFAVDHRLDGFRQQDNGYYLRSFAPEQRMLIGKYTIGQLSDYITNPLFGDPRFAGAPSDPERYAPDQMMMLSLELDFDSFFATNPEYLKRNIGLQREAFKDFSFPVR